MKTRKQKALFRKSLNKVYPYAIVALNDDGTFVNATLYEFRSNRKTFKLGIKPIKKEKSCIKFIMPDKSINN